MNRRSDSHKSFEISVIWRIMFQIPVGKIGAGGLCVCGEGISSYRKHNIEKNTLFLCGILVSKELGAKVHELRRTL